jgi:hypothetical protein
MTKYIVTASEVVYYLKVVDADSPEQIEDMVYKGELEFTKDDITDGWDFQISNIQEDK